MKKKRSIALVLVLSIVIIIAALGFLTSFIGYKQFTSVLEKQYNDSAYEVAETVKSILDADKLETYLETKERDEDYDRIESILDKMVVDMDLNFIYVAKVPLDNLLQSNYIFDSVNPKTGFSRYPLGYQVEDMDPAHSDELKKVLETGGRAQNYLYSYTDTEAHTSATLGVKDSSGKVVAIVVAEKPMSILVEARNTYVKNILILALIIIVAAILLYTLFLTGFLIRPLKEITNEAERFAEDHSELQTELKAAKSSFETGVLARSIRKMETDINEYIRDLTQVTAEKERIGAELNVATQIQADMLPRIFPPFPDRNEFDLYASMSPAKEVGGDFYDFFMVDDDHIALVMADVSGKGVPAALFMVIAKTLIKNRAQMGGSPSEVLVFANEQLCEGNEAELFVTVWMAIIEISTGKGVATNAGHEHPVIKRSGGEFELVVYRHSPAVATMEGLPFRQHEFELHPGDSLFVYTDGVPEATNSNDELYGTDRMLAVMNQNKSATTKELLDAINADVDAFVGEAPQFDDLTMLAFQYYGPENV